MSEREYQFFESFHIDEGELSGLSPQEIFVLGFEFARHMDLLKDGAIPSEPVMCHANNTGRIANMAMARGVTVKTLWMKDGWASLLYAKA